jgi:DNA-binding Xre family transcriptional regulator
MTIEESLRAYILEKYCSMNNFCNEIGLLPQTMSAIFKRGIKTCSSGNLFKICDELDISIDSLKDGRIESRMESGKYKVNVDYLVDFLGSHCILEANDKPLNKRDLAKFCSYLEFSCELMRHNQQGRHAYPIMASVPMYEENMDNDESESKD